MGTGYASVETGAEERNRAAIRREQLRRAKRRQRKRERQLGLSTVAVRLPQRLALKLKAGARRTEFTAALHAFLEREILCIDDYENLRLIAWNRAGRYVSREEAFHLYERNWRFVYRDRLSEAERELIAKLAEKHGNGIIHA